MLINQMHSHRLGQCIISKHERFAKNYYFTFHFVNVAGLCVFDVEFRIHRKGTSKLLDVVSWFHVGRMSKFFLLVSSPGMYCYSGRNG